MSEATEACVFPASSFVARAEWEPDGECLSLHLNSGAVLEYWGVPKAVYMDLTRSPSPGRFYHQSIRGKYQVSKGEVDDQSSVATIVRDDRDADLPDTQV